MDGTAGPHTCPRNLGTWYETLEKDEASFVVLAEKCRKVQYQMAGVSFKKPVAFIEPHCDPGIELDQLFSTCGSWPPQGHMSDIYSMVYNSNKISVMKEQ